MIQKIKRIFLEEDATHDTSLSIKMVYKMVTAVAYSQFKNGYLCSTPIICTLANLVVTL